MLNKINFTKMSGTGNDFIVFDNRENILPENKGSLAKLLCERKVSIGADGLLILENSGEADFTMRIINQDGSEPEMCGNGARCIALYAFINKMAEKKMSFMTKAGLISAEIFGNNVKLKMTDPVDYKQKLPFSLDNDGISEISFINTGVPHAVIFIDNIEKIDVNKIGSIVRYHDYFVPSGTNVNFVEIIDKSAVKVRTYERGVESETLACGSGSTASAIIAGLTDKVISPVNVHTKGRDILKIYFNIDKSNESISEVYLEGNVEITFQGTVELQ